MHICNVCSGDDITSLLLKNENVFTAGGCLTYIACIGQISFPVTINVFHLGGGWISDVDACYDRGSPICVKKKVLNDGAPLAQNRQNFSVYFAWFSSCTEAM